MPRKQRVPSPTGIYHVMLRGINRSDIFHDEIDFMKMEKILRSMAKPVDKKGNPQKPLCKIYAYCLMTNHIHLLIAEIEEPIGTIVKRLGVAYVSYYNKRRKRTGPLFEGRFRSEPVDGSEYFITLLHYIHNNPVKAGMTIKPGWYKWSSMREYELTEEAYERGFCDQTIPFKNLTRSEVRDIVLNVEDLKSFVSPVDKERVDNADAEEILKSLVPEEFSDYNLRDLPKVVKLALSSKAQANGITKSQLVNLVGVTKYSLYRGKTKRIRTVK